MLNNRKAFTLIELIMAMTIIAVILVIIFGAFRIGIRAWEKGEKDIDKQQRYRIALELIKRQVTSITYKRATIDDKEEIILKGDDKSFEFTSHVAFRPENKFGVVHVKYMVVEAENSGDKLLAYEKNMVLYGRDAKYGDIDPDAFFELVPYARSISFEYLKPPEQDLEEQPEWQDKWDSENDQNLPLAFKLTLHVEPESAPVILIAPFYQQEE